MSALEEWRTKATRLSGSDRIGHVIARTFDVMTTVVRDGVGSESVCDLLELLTQDRAFAKKKDNNVSTPLRELVYGMIESFGSTIEDIAKKRVEEILKMGETPMNGSKPNSSVHQSDESAGDTLPLFTDYSVKEEPIDMIELNDIVKTEEEEEEWGQALSETMMPSPVETYDEPGTSQQPDHKRPRLSIQSISYGQILRTDGQIGHGNNMPSNINEHEPINQYMGGNQITTAVRFRCVICSKVFGTKLGLCGHMAVHTKLASPSAPFQCSVCYKGFDVKAALFSHMVVHDSQKKNSKRKFPCFLCHSVAYANESSLTSHMCLHTGEHSHKCPMGGCPEGFNSDWYLKRHLSEVHRVQPYECSTCGLKFDRISLRDQHRAEMH